MDNQLIFSPFSEPSQVAEARRQTVQQATALGFSEVEAGQVAIVVTEAATNLIKHATEGRLLVRAFSRGDISCIEVLTLDQGPGIANIGECLRDGYSTTGSLGTGFGAIMRLSSLFDIYSLPGRGTALLAQLWKQTGQRLTNAGNKKKDSGTSNPYFPLEVGVVCLPKPGQVVSGDYWGIELQAGRSLVMLVDGLGHGSAAATAAQAAVRVLSEKSTLSPAGIVESAHAALSRTRGAALAVVELDSTRGARFAGIGNITGVIFTPEQSHHLTSHNGIVGHQVSKVQEFDYFWAKDALLVLHSDGLTSRWNFDTYPGLMARHPGLIAGVLYRDFCRGYDDVTVLAVKQQ